MAKTATEDLICHEILGTNGDRHECGWDEAKSPQSLKMHQFRAHGIKNGEKVAEPKKQADEEEKPKRRPTRRKKDLVLVDVWQGQTVMVLVDEEKEEVWIAHKA